MRRVVDAVTVVTGVKGGAGWHDVRGIVVIVVVTKPKLRGGAKVCVERKDKDQGKVAKVTAGHNALLQAKRATRQAMRCASKKRERKTAQRAN